MAFTTADITTLEAAYLNSIAGRKIERMSLGDKSIQYTPTSPESILNALAMVKASLGLVSMKTVAGNIRRPAR